MKNSRVYLKSLRLYFSVFISFSLATNHLAFGVDGNSPAPEPIAPSPQLSNAIKAAITPGGFGSQQSQAAGAEAKTTPPTPDKPTEATMVGCNKAPLPTFPYRNFTESFNKLHEAEVAYYAKCNEGILSGQLKGADGGVSDGSGAGSSSVNSELATSGTAILSGFKGTCDVLEEELDGLREKADADLKSEKPMCITDAKAKGILNPLPPPAIATCEVSVQLNEQSCNKTLLNNNSKLEKAWAWVKSNKLLLASLLAAAGMGAYMLASSGDKQKEEFQTNPTPGPTTEKDKEADKEKGKDDIVNAGETTPTNTPTPIVETQIVNSADNSGIKGYCRSSNQPLECFVTPGCDLKCVADKYGVSNYAGMDKDTTRIDKNGRPVDGASAATGNPGGSSSSLGGDSKSSGKGGAALNASGETGSGNGGSNVGTRSASGYGDGSDGFGGGGGGGFGDSSNRDPASNDRYKGQGIFGGKNAAGSKDPAATGPLLPITANLFERISNVAKTQCVRELVLCNQK